MNSLPVNDGSAHHPSTTDGDAYAVVPAHHHICATHLKAVTINAHDHSVICLTQPRGILGHHIQHRLDIRRRAGDDA